MSNKLTSSRVHLVSLSNHNVGTFGAKIWINSRWLTIVNVYAPGSRVSESWLQQLANHIVPPLLIHGNFNQKHHAWRSTFNTPGSEEILNWLISINVCILNTSHPTHSAPSGSQSLIDLSFPRKDIFRLTDIYVHPDLFDFDHCPIIHKINFALKNYVHSSTNWESMESSLKRVLEKKDHISIEHLHRNFRQVVNNNTFKHLVQRRDNPSWWKTVRGFSARKVSS